MLRRFAFASPLRPAVVAGAAGAMRRHGDEPTGDRTKPLPLTVTLPDGTAKALTVYDGQNLIEIAHEHKLPVEAACAGSCACSTCHCYLDPDVYNTFPEPSDEEYDMLDLAYMPTPQSRLGCQIKFKKGVHDGANVRLPKATPPGGKPSNLVI